MNTLDLYRRSFSKEDINALPLRRYSGRVDIISSKKALTRALQLLESECLLGFDTETRPVFKKGKQNPPSLLQLATGERVFLFQLNAIGLPDALGEVLAAKDIVKTGVAVRDDIKELQQLNHFDAAGFIDLGDRARDLELSTNGLRNLAANLLGFRVSKSAQCSNWAARNLSQKQINYAATDAWVSRELYIKLKELGAL